MGRDLAADVNDNWTTWLRTLAERIPGGESRAFGPAVAASTGVDNASLNRVAVFEDAAREDLDAAASWLSGLDVPFAVTAAGPGVDAVKAADLGLDRTDGTSPGMALSSLAEPPDPDSPAEISAVEDPADLSEVARVYADAVGVPIGQARPLFPDALLSVPEVDLFLGRIDGRAVASGQLLRTGEVAGGYFIDVLEEHRRQGIGTAMTWHVLASGASRGDEVGVLVSTPMGTPLYEDMGFETVVTHHHWMPEG